MATPSSDRNTYTSYLRDQSWILVSHVLIYARGIILLPILVKNLGVDLYGLYVLLMLSADLLFGISSLGIGYRFRRHMPSARTRDERSELFFSQFYPHLLFVTVVCALAAAASAATGVAGNAATGTATVALFCALIAANFLFAKATDYIRYTDRQRLLAVMLSVNPYLAIALIVLFLVALERVGIDQLLLASILSMGGLALPLLAMIAREIGIASPRLEARRILEDIRQGFPLVLSYIVDFILASSDRYLIALYLGTTAVGMYNPAYTLGSLAILVPKALGIVLPPSLARAVDAGREEEAETLVRHSIRGFVAVAVPFAVGGALLAHPILVLFANAEVAAAAYLLVPVISVAILFYGVNSILASVLFVRGETALIFRITFTAAAVNLILNAVLLHEFRAIMVPALTTLFSYALALAISWSKLRPLPALRGETGKWLRILLASLAMGLLILLFRGLSGDSSFVMVFTVCAAIIFYLYAIVLLKVYTPQEVRAFVTNLA